MTMFGRKLWKSVGMFTFLAQIPSSKTTPAYDLTSVRCFTFSVVKDLKPGKYGNSETTAEVLVPARKK